MAIKVTMVQRVSSTLPVGEYQVEVVGIRTSLSRLINKRTGERDQLIFIDCRVSEGKYTGSEISALSSLYLSPNSKLNKILQAFGFNVKPRQEFDLENLIGKEALALVIKKVDSKGNEFSTIDSFIPNKSVKPEHYELPF